MDNIKELVNRFILDPNNADVLAVVKAARNGAVYGAKVRFPHALVMVFLFRVREKIHLILRATRQHSRNLAVFATLYKTICLVLRRTSPTGKERRYDTFVAGLLGAYVVFGRGAQSSVNQQISIYVFARVVLALAKLAVQPGGLVPTDVKGRVAANAWPVFASVSWAFVMYLYRWHPETLQPSLKSSMKYIYSNADTWDGFRNFLIHNQ
ncbi:MAG: hypothetical protein M1832_002070 [Thelocarpon impressellum]|nr:MAG: hypothetical protein M1832_002070 [Thelocarpon impressellum]